MAEPTRPFAIATPHRAATAAGRAAFAAGGNAVDAALAAACTLTVVYPHMCAVGGDVMALVHDGRAHAVNGSGRAALSLPRDAVRGGVAIRGVDTITVPGAVAAWRTLAERWGTVPLARALEGAAALALEGVPVAPALGRSLAANPGLIAADRGLAAVFAPAGSVLCEGDLLVQERLGQTLRRLAAHGADDLYRGETAARLIAGLRERGSHLSLADLDAHRTDVEPVLRRTIGDEDVLTMGPNSQGFSLPQILAAVDHMELRDPLATEAPLLAAIFRESARDRDRHLADPAAMDRPVEELLSGAHIAGLAARAVAASAGPVARPHADGDTVALVAADGSGLAVSLIQSIYFGFGSGVLEPDTGILLHNRGACFSADPDSPNALGPGKRPLHTLMPVVLTRGGRVRWVAGTMGGHAQAQIHAQMLLRRRAGGDPETAVSSPRFVVGELGAADAGEVCLEEDFAAARAAFEQAGQAPALMPRWDDSAGHAHAIAVRPDGSFNAASDPRADGGASTGV
jgi:gamma-glutamyltranspeptidase